MFKDDVLYYLGKTPCNLFEEDEENDKKKKEEDEEDTCPDCGKKSAECECGEEDDEEDEKKASKSTETAGGDDGDDGYHYSVSTKMPADFGATPEELEMIRVIKKNNGFGKSFVPETPEEKKMLELMNKILKHSTVKTALPGDFNKVTQNKGASENSPDLKDDHTNGRNGSCQTESIFNY